MSDQRRKWAIAACAALSLIGGGSYAYTTNVLLATPCDASCSADQSFRKPWWATFCVLFVQAVGTTIILALVRSWQHWVKKKTDDAPAGFGTKTAGVFDRDMRVPMIVVTLVDTSTVFLQSIASLYIPAAINGAMRGTLLLLTAALSKALGVFDGGAGRLEWGGIVVSTVGSVLIGAATIASATLLASSSGTSQALVDAGNAGTAALGIGLSLLSNVTLAFGICYETRVFEKRRPSSLSLNSVRSFAGSAILLLAIVIASFAPPARDHGSFENGSHTACCVTHTPAIAAFSLTIGLGATVSGTAALLLSALAGSNFRALVYVGRALWVWVLELTVFYAGASLHNPNAGLYGRPWTPLLSYPQLAGFILIASGGAMTWRGRARRMTQREAEASALELQPIAVEGGGDESDDEPDGVPRKQGSSQRGAGGSAGAASMPLPDSSSEGAAAASTGFSPKARRASGN